MRTTPTVPTPVWVHLDGWAGRTAIRGELVKRNPARSRVRIIDRGYAFVPGEIRAVPNRAITPREKP